MDRALDNVNQAYPARMSDGRQFTDYRANCIMNNEFSENEFVGISLFLNK